jgi:hypothetical protein
MIRKIPTALENEEDLGRQAEKLVWQFLDRNLDDTWEIYHEPYINGLRPDFILLNSKKGLIAVEVKAWNLQNAKYWCEFEHKDLSPRLKYRSAINETIAVDRLKNPIDQIERYQAQIQSLYCPRTDRKFGLPVFKVIAFPFASKSDVLSAFKESLKHYRWIDSGGYIMAEHCNILGREDFKDRHLGAVLPWVGRNRDFGENWSEERAEEVKFSWLSPPEFQRQAQLPFTLSDKQAAIAKSSHPFGKRRVKGPAGSGKSVLIAARAAYLASQETPYNVLIVTYNITLKRYLEFLIRALNPNALETTTIIHFHLLCRDICIATGYINKLNEVYSEGRNSSNKVGNEVFENQVPGLVQNILKQKNAYPKYDSILVDEGQDFNLSWWILLQTLLHDNGEMLLVADYTQNVYGKTHWISKPMTGAGFVGPWMEFKESYRLPELLADKARFFVEEFLRGEELCPPIPVQRGFPNQQLRWVQVNGSELKLIAHTFLQSLEILKSSPDTNALDEVKELKIASIPDLTVLVQKRNLGRALAKLFDNKGLSLSTTFDPSLIEKDVQLEDKNQKSQFYVDRGRVKISTVHSFKGWEASVIVVMISKATSETDLYTIYTALSRLSKSIKKGFLTIVCNQPRLRKYGRTHWENDYIEV